MIKPIEFSLQVSQFLNNCALKSDDVTRQTHLLGFCDDGQLVGVVGLDLCDGFGLLRSLAVQPAARGQGLAAALVREMEFLAHSLGISQVNTAANFFARQGYQVMRRMDAPLPIQSTAQFSSLCPDSAVLMFKMILSK